MRCSSASSAPASHSRRFPEHHHRHGEDIAFIAYGLDIGLLAGVIDEALAETTHHQVDRAIEQLGVATLGEVEQLVAREDSLRVIEEHPQQAELRAAQRDDGAF